MDIANHDLSGGRHLDQHIAMLADKLGRRQALAAARALETAARESTDTTEPLREAVEAARTALATAQRSSRSLLERLLASAYDPKAQPPREEVVMTIAGVPFAAGGNISVLQGKNKAGKSAAVSSILGAAMRGRYAVETGDLLGFEWITDSQGAILHFDTEQSPRDYHDLVTRAVVRAGGAFHYRRLLSIPLVKGLKFAERWEGIKLIIEQKMKDEHGVDLVVIDGIADICRSPNDEEEAIMFVAEIMEIAHRHGIAFVLVLHENPGTDIGKTRGHLGSELGRKAFASIRVEKDEDDVSTMWGDQMRKGALPKSKGICYQFNPDAKMHTQIGTGGSVEAAKVSAKAEEQRDEHRAEAARILGSEALSYNGLVRRIEADLMVSAPTAKRRIRDWKAIGVIQTNDQGMIQTK